MVTPPVPADRIELRRRRVAVIVGSTRPTRICPGIARWLLDAMAEGSSLDYELVDLAEVGLPFLDEPLMAALGHYEHEHTRAWSRTISAFDGFVLVFPQYNWGYPASLKNALDFLYHEWAGKPVACATYGTRGGGKGAEQMRGVLAGLKMRELPDHLQISIGRDDIDEHRQLLDVHALMGAYRPQARALDEQMTEALEDGQE